MHRFTPILTLAALLTGCTRPVPPPPVAATPEQEPAGARLTRAEAIRLARKAYLKVEKTIESDMEIEAGYSDGGWLVKFIPRRLREQNFPVGPPSVLVDDKTGKTQFWGGA